MQTHVELESLDNEKWLMSKTLIKAVNTVITPEWLKDKWTKTKIVIVTTFELMPPDENGEEKPWQIMVKEDYKTLKKLLAE